MLRNKTTGFSKFIISLMFCTSALFSQQHSNKYDVSLYNVAWNTPSIDFTGSVPIGNGDIGLNVWVEKNGDLLFLISKTDSYDENSTLLKLGRIRLRLTPNPFTTDSSFSQVLNLNKGEILIKEGKNFNIRLWVDANNPVINVETSGKQEFMQEVFLETWRDSVKKMEVTQVSDMFKTLSGADPYATYTYPDNYEKNNNKLLWYHQNIKPEPDGYEINLKLQGLDESIKSHEHPLFNRIFGAVAEGENLVTENNKKLVSEKKNNKFCFSIYALTMHPATREQWKSKLDKIIETYKNSDLKVTKQKHDEWWSSFWNRSGLKITKAGAKEDSVTYMVSRGYNLCRYMNACGGRGSLPIKFNGSIFSYGEKENPDFMRWGGPGFWFQNERLVYDPMFAQGDFDLLQPWFNMYHNILPLQKERTKKFFNHEGAFFPETPTFWGAEVSAHYGWTPFNKRKNPLAECTYQTYLWQNGIEQMLMMYDYFEYTQDTLFAKNILIPHAEEITKFYDLHYQLDNQKKMHIGPAQALETYQVALNPMPEVAGLKYTLNKLLSLPADFSTSDQKIRWKLLLERTPAIPMQESDGEKYLVPARMWDMKMNIENPELYAVFPYRIYGLGKADIDIAKNTFNRRLFKKEACWYQNAVDAALLGFVDTAKQFVISRSAPASYSDSRFPAMWNAFNDWIPDVDHGGNLQLALNYMLLQCEGKEIRLLPCWPKDWDVEFKLRAPYNTIIEGSYVNGKLDRLIVTPESRKEDIVLP